MTISKHVLIILAIIVLASLAGNIYLWKQVSDLRQNPNAAAQKEIQDVVSKVSRLMVLPEGEAPSVATVTDPEKLKDQAFFNKAQKGDKVLIYTNAKKAVLYSPSTNKIVEVAPLNIGSSKGEIQQAAPQKGK